MSHDDLKSENQADQTQSQDTPASAQGLEPDSNLPSSIAYDSDNAFLDIQRQFESLRDRLSRIQIPSYCKVNDSAVGIKSVQAHSQDRLQIPELTPSEVGARHSTLPILIPDDLISSTIVEVPREWTFPRHDETTPSSIHDPVCRWFPEHKNIRVEPNYTKPTGERLDFLWCPNSILVNATAFRNYQ
ncbi:hypothetical protein RRG08_008887 [Elysia crispata]|uniref:Uncharacterized protein n=1 Tax=Elysia crispata TaxID=231223 RepID=A0AAE0ZWX5_9GAST|nr:hypothetical protein RRG08_008887 [Elysia crispata]